MFIVISLSPFLLAEATNVQWQENNNVSPENKDAHYAPRSQKYWDEHGIKRPDYAKTDAEVAAESGGSWAGVIVVVSVLSLFLMSGIAWYGFTTGDWDTILNNPACAYIANCINRFTETTGIRGHRLGTSTAASKVGNDEEARRTARLARFEGQDQKNILDSMKSE